MKILINERLSKHRCKTPEGYLICTDAILARTGKQTYRKNEIFKDSDDETEIEVDRTEDEVFSPQTLASFENKPVTVEHPDEDVNVHNYKEYAVGFVRDVHRGEVNGQPVILGNLVITDEQTIQEIENGEHTDLSCGYDCDIADEANPCQRNIRGNHVALCECGRAGIARIVDSKCKDSFDIEFDLGFRKTRESYNNRKDADERYDELIRLSKKPSMRGMTVKKLYDSCKDSIKDEQLASYRNIDSVKDKLVEPSKQLINDIIISMTSLGFKVEYTGKTWSGRTHLEFGKSCSSDREYHQLINEVDKHLDKIERRYSAPITYNYAGDCGPNGSGQVTLVVDINKMQIHDANHLPAKVKRDLQKFLNHKSTFIRNKDYDIAEFVKEFERVSRLWAEFPLKIVRESIKGWFKTGDGMMRKDYEFSIEGYDDRFMVSLYAKPDTYETTELNAYFTDSVKDAKYVIMHPRKNLYLTVGAKTWSDESDPMIKKFDSEKEAEEYAKKNTSDFRIAVFDSVKDAQSSRLGDKDSFKPGDKIRHIEGDVEVIDKIIHESTFSGKIVKKYVMKSGRKYLAEDIETDHWHKMTDSVNDTLIPPTKEAINWFESLLRTSNIEIEKKGLTMFGRVHYQVRAFMPFNQFVKKLDRIDNEMNKLGIPMTFNAGADDEECTAGIDLDKQYVKDSQRTQKIQKIIKVVKSIK